PDQVPARVRDRLAAAAGRGGRRGHPRAPALGARRPARAVGRRPAALRRVGHARRRRARIAPGGGGAAGKLMSVTWYLLVSAIVFCVGVGGVLTRRNPLVILLCLELMLNAANLALIGFSKMWGNGDGQIFAIIVMVVAACEVTVGLGVIVALYRRRLPIDADQLRELHG